MLPTRKISEIAHRFLSAIPLIKNSIKPQDFYPDIETWWKDMGQQKGGNKLLKNVLPANKLNRALPKTIDPEIY